MVGVMDATTKTRLKKWAFVAAGVSAVAAVLRKLGWPRRSVSLGSVSEQWILEHLLGPGSRRR
jgi:hypothetical protein